MEELSLTQQIAVITIPVIFAITVHEAAHGYVAKQFGDMTAYAQGRISLNPLRHIDPIGTVLVPMLLYWSTHGAFLFGWAKPVPVNFSKLRHPKRDMLWVAAAGPFSNLVMAVLWMLAYKISLGLAPEVSDFLKHMAGAGITINVVLMVLNLLPLPPLDGGRIAVSLLPHRLAYQFSQIERYGFVILLVLMFTGILGRILGPLIDATIGLLTWFLF